MATNTIDPGLLSAKINILAPERPNTALGFTTAAGLLVATLTQPLIGALSDRNRSRWGRRVPYMVIGALFAAVSLIGLALAPSLALLVLGMLAWEIGANTAQAPWQALLPDLVPSGQRGLASGLKTLFEILSFVAGRRISSYLIADDRLVAANALAAGVLLLATAITARTALHSHQQDSTPSNDRPATPPAPHSKPWSAGLGWWFANRALFWGAAIALNNFVLFYLVDVIEMTFEQAVRFFGDLSLVLGLCLVAVTIPAGRLSDRIGRRPLILGACVVALAGNLLLLTARSRPALIAAGGTLGMAVGIYLAANWALATDLVPRSSAARYLGIANIATAGGSFLARFAGGAMIDPLNRLAGNQSAGYTTLYSLTLVAFVLSAIAVLKLPRSAFAGGQVEGS